MSSSPTIPEWEQHMYMHDMDTERYAMDGFGAQSNEEPRPEFNRDDSPTVSGSKNKGKGVRKSILRRCGLINWAQPLTTTEIVVQVALATLCLILLAFLAFAV